MKSNDALLSHLVASDEATSVHRPKYKLDETVHNPESIEVPANEVVYIHFLKSHDKDFHIEITTPHTVRTVVPENTLDGCSNTIIRAIGNIKFKCHTPCDFYVQYLRIYY